jgi:FRG domain
VEIPIESWPEFRSAIEERDLSSWAFRGQALHSWPLFSSLSRYLLECRVHPDAWVQQESRIIRIFKRKSHLLLPRVPDKADTFQWLALMQHHGAPTRLLDFTRSPYVAAFFALERATDDAAVWALHPPTLAPRATRTVRASQNVSEDEIGPWVPGGFERDFLPNTNAIVVIGEPHVMNRRLVAQGGTFAIPGMIGPSVVNSPRRWPSESFVCGPRPSGRKPWRIYTT